MSDVTAPTAPTDPQTVDPVLADAVAPARAAAVEMAGAEVGEHLGVRRESEFAATHAFAASLPGYVGWCWAVTVVRAPDCPPTIAEVVLLPGDDSLLAPVWVPWSERLQPGDLSPGDLLPSAPDDPRLVPGYLDSDDPMVTDTAFELGLGRVRVLSRSGRLDAADRWFDGDFGPDNAMAKQAPAHCGTCGFFVSLSGSLQAAFGVCANEIAGADGRVVSVEFGCGAHSETIAEPVVDESGELYEDELIDIEPRGAAESDLEVPADEVADVIEAEADALLAAEDAESDAQAAVEVAAEDVVEVAVVDVEAAEVFESDIDEAEVVEAEVVEGGVVEGGVVEGEVVEGGNVDASEPSAEDDFFIG